MDASISISISKLAENVKSGLPKKAIYQSIKEIAALNSIDPIICASLLNAELIWSGRKVLYFEGGFS